MNIKAGINGFGRIGRIGRIGRMVFRAAKQNFKNDIEVVVINDLLEPDSLACMLQYDSAHGRFKDEVAVDGAAPVVDGKRIRLSVGRDPAAPKRREVCTSVFGADAGIALDKTFVKVVDWHDNDRGYPNRVPEMVRVIGAPR